MYLYPCAPGYTDERIADAGPPHTGAHVVRDRAHTHPRRHMRAPSVGVDRGWLGLQAFNSASAFNANIGAWNTAAVTFLDQVCAAFSARAARHRGRDALGRDVGAARAVVRGGAADARARVCVCDWAPADPRRHMRARSVGVDRGWLGSQAFTGAWAFNANIGAWNTATVKSLYYVCVAFGRSGAQPRARRA